MDDRLVCSGHVNTYNDAHRIKITHLANNGKNYNCDDCRKEGRNPCAIAVWRIRYE
jgi:hypothetical protein